VDLVTALDQIKVLSEGLKQKEISMLQEQMR
jgi:hypothetical protein